MVGPPDPYCAHRPAVQGSEPVVDLEERLGSQFICNYLCATNQCLASPREVPRPKIKWAVTLFIRPYATTSALPTTHDGAECNGDLTTPTPRPLPFTTYYLESR
jgi:hypothetical protein